MPNKQELKAQELKEAWDAYIITHPPRAGKKVVVARQVVLSGLAKITIRVYDT